MKISNDAVVLASRGGVRVAALANPPIGHLQAIVLKRLSSLGQNASGREVLKSLSKNYGVLIDSPQIYACIRKLLNKKLITHAGTRTQSKGPPLKIYGLTAEGFEILRVTAEHHNAVAKLLA